MRSQAIHRLGFWSAVLTFVLSITFIIGAAAGLFACMRDALQEALNQALLKMLSVGFSIVSIPLLRRKKSLNMYKQCFKGAELHLLSMRHIAGGCPQ